MYRRHLSTMTITRCFVVVVTFSVACADLLSDMDADVIDMTHTITEITPGWGLRDYFRMKIVARNITPGNYWYEANSFSSPEHLGTHMDAPSHFSQGKNRTHQVRLRSLIGQAIRISNTEAAEHNPDFQVTVDILKRWEDENGRIPNNSILLFNHGWSLKWPRGSMIYGTKNISDLSSYHFPGIHPDAAKWLVNERPGVSAVAIDTPSVDYGQSRTFDCHRIFASAGVLGLENVANMHLVPSTNATLIALPMKHEDGSGSPVRIIAIIPHKSVSYTNFQMPLWAITILVCSFLVFIWIRTQ